MQVNVKTLLVALFTALIVLFSTSVGNAATRTASVSGNWSSTTTWGGLSVPTASDDVIINSGISLTVNIADAQCASLTFAAVLADSYLTIAGTNSLTISGELFMPRPSRNNTDCVVNVNDGYITSGSLNMRATSIGRNDIINISTGILTVTGTLTTRTQGSQILFSNAGTLNMGLLSGTPTLTTVSGCSVNYTGNSAQIIYNITYNGNLGLSGSGTKTMDASITTHGNLTVGSGTPFIINSTMTAIVDGDIDNSGSITLTAGTSTTDTWLRMAGDLTNNPGATIDASGDYTRFIFVSTNAQTFTNNGIITSPVSSFGVANSNASGLTMAGSNNVVIARANLFFGEIHNASLLTIGNGGTSTAFIQRGVLANTLPAGSFADAPTFDVGSGGLTLMYDDGSIAYSTGYEVPGSLTTADFQIYDAADVTLGSDLTISSSLSFVGGNGIPKLRIGAHTLTIDGAIDYTVTGEFYGGLTSNLILNGSNTLNTIIDGLNNFTINADNTLAGSVLVNNTLTLSSGILINSTYLTMADGSTISRSQGSLNVAPTFAGTVNLLYTGGTPITTGFEMPLSPTVLNNLTTNTGGVVQGTNLGVSTNILTDAFNNLSSWTGDIGNSNNQYTTTNTSYSGGTAREARYYYGVSANTNYTAAIYRSVNTTGYTSLNISWKQFVDNWDASYQPYTIKVQCATSTGGPWTDIYSLSPTGTANIGPETKSYSNWTTNVGGTFYIRYYITGYTYGLDYWYFDDLVIEGEISNVPSTVSVNGTLGLSAGTYSISGNSLVLNGAVSGSSAIVGSSTSNLTAAGSASNLVIPSISNGLNNFTINRATGVTLNSDATIFGILNLQSANPSSTQGALQMGTNTLTMESSATTSGIGDVTGIVKRTAFVPGINYSFGNQYTTIVIDPGGTLPTDISFKISIGTAPSWKTTALQRDYDIIQTGGTGTTLTLSLHYLDSELQSNTENNLIIWDYIPSIPELNELGKANQNTTENWVAISNRDLSYFPTAFDNHHWCLADLESTTYVWEGSVSSDWNEPGNWANGLVPTVTSDVVIPDASTTLNDPILPLSPAASLNTISIQSNGILEGGTATTLTVAGGGGAWINLGTLNAGTSTVIFTNQYATISGITDFYNVTIDSGAGLTMAFGGTMRIGGTILNNGIWNVRGLQANIVEYNGGDQTVLNPNGSVSGYHNLILSGSGIKTMPNTTLQLHDDFFITGSASATALAALVVGGNITIDTGTTLDLGSFAHNLGGNLTNNGGTLTTLNSSITFDGSVSQTINSAPGISFVDLSITNTTETVTLGLSTDCSIGGNLTLSAGAVFDLVSNSLTSVTGSVSSLGTIITQNTSATPVPAGKTWDGYFEYAGSGAQTLVNATYKNLTISGTGGVTANTNITVQGILNMVSANPSDTKGLLDMGNYTLLMDSLATTIGVGDVTGIVRRTTINVNTTYTFGHQHTSIFFPEPLVGTLPSELSLKISLGTTPSWKPDAIKRIYDFIRVGGGSTQALLHAHYLESELNGNAEDAIVDYLYIIPTSQLIEYGRAAYNTDENWVAISNVNIAYFQNSFGIMEVSMAESQNLPLTWNGSVSTSWVTAANWTPNGAPSDHTAITIPDASTTNFDLSIPIIATCGSIKMESGAIINASSGAELTINDGEGAWNNIGGTFNSGNSTILFKSDSATISGTTDFHNITIDAGAKLTMDDGTYIGIIGNFINYGTLSTVEKGATTVEYKGGDQAVVVPNTATNRYSTLILSGSGSKVMPDTELTIVSDFTVSGTASVLTDANLIFNSNVNISNGTSFIAESFAHSIAGNLTNDGNYTASTGGTLTMNGTLAQTVGGSGTSIIDNFTINNSLGVTLLADLNVNNTLALSTGNLSVGANTLGLNGAVNKTTGFLNVTTTSSLNFGGTASLTLPNDLFSSTPTIENLTINRTNGITLGNQGISVSGILDMKSGTFTIGANELSISGSSPTRTTGTIDASNESSTLTFANPAAIILPAGIFSADVNNVNLYGAGGVTAKSDFILGGILNLNQSNPSSTKGILDLWDGSVMKTLTLDIYATIVGAGDVTGYVRRIAFEPYTDYSFGNQFTTVTFITEGTYPTELIAKISIGAAPSWKSDAILRTYDFIQSGGSNCFASISTHYLDSELNGNNENDLVHWTNGTPGPPLGLYEWGRSDFNTTNNWVAISNIDIGEFPSGFGELENTLAAPTITSFVWNGSISTSWDLAGNWTPNGVPTAASAIIIPDAATTTFSPTLPLSAEIKTMTIEASGVVNSEPGAQLTIHGHNGAWNNLGGIFNSGSSNIIFIDPNATYSGNTNFYDLNIQTGAELWMSNGSTIGIAGSMANDGAWHTISSGPTTVDYNGGDQTVVIPNSTTNRYSTLQLSGSGIKTMPSSALNIVADLLLSGSTTVNAAASIDVEGNLDIGSNCTLNAGTYNHTLIGDFTNDGTFTSASGSTFTFIGTAAQTIAGLGTCSFDNLTIDNTAGVLLSSDALSTVSSSLTINTDTKFEIAPGKQLSATGTITNNAGTAGFVLQSDASGTAALIHNTNSVPATVQRYISGDAEAWHFLSSPVSAQAISGSWTPTGTYGNGSGYDLYLWNEPTFCWIYQLNTTTVVNWNTVHPGTDFMVGRGYLYSVQALNPTKAFVGNLNNGVVNYGLTIGSTDLSLKGFSLVGNPYPSSIDWQATLGWTRTDLVNSAGGYDMWVWNPTANNYGVCNSATGIVTNGVSRYIAPMQGFFVQAVNAGNLGMDNDVRVLDGANNWFKHEYIDSQNLSLSVKSEDGYGSDEIQLSFGYTENQNGTKKLFSNTVSAPSLYMGDEGNYLSVRYLSNTEENSAIPIQFTAGMNGDYSIKGSFDPSIFDTVVLQDRKTGAIQDLIATNTYHFQSSTTDAANRFVLHFKQRANYSNNEFPAIIYTDGTQLIVDLSLIEKDADLSVYNIMGELIMKDKLKGKVLHKLNLDAQLQILIVSVKNPDGSLSQKILWGLN